MTTAVAAQFPDDDPREFRMIRARDLYINPNVQRELDPEKTARMCNEFSWNRFEVVTVVRNKDGSYTVVEGQHRAFARQQLNPDGLVPCMVILDPTTTKQQAQIAMDIQQGRRAHSAYEKWRLRYNSGHEHEVYAETVLERHGVRLGQGPSSMTISAVATVRRIVHGGHFSAEYGAELLDKTIVVIMAAFPTYDHESNVNRWNRDILLATAETLNKYPDIDSARLAGAFAVRPAAQWMNISKGAEQMPGYQKIQLSVAAEYNRNRRRGRIFE